MFKWLVGKIDCLVGVHDWSPEEFNEFLPLHDVGDEAFLYCHRCGKLIVGIIKQSDGGIKWQAYDNDAILYDINPKFAKEKGQKYNIDKFREENK